MVLEKGALAGICVVLLLPCVRVDVFLDLGPDLDLVGITSSFSSVDLTCADLTDEAGADSAGDLSGDQT